MSGSRARINRFLKRDALAKLVVRRRRGAGLQRRQLFAGHGLGGHRLGSRRPAGALSPEPVPGFRSDWAQSPAANWPADPSTARRMAHPVARRRCIGTAAVARIVAFGRMAEPFAPVAAAARGAVPGGTRRPRALGSAATTGLGRDNQRRQYRTTSPQRHDSLPPTIPWPQWAKACGAPARRSAACFGRLRPLWERVMSLRLVARYWRR